MIDEEGDPVLGLPALGDVARDALHPDGLVSFQDQAGIHLQRHQAPILGREVDVEGSGPPVRQAPFEHVADHPQLVRREERGEVDADQLVSPVAAHPLTGGVDRCQHAVEVVGVDDVVGVLHQGPVPFLAEPEPKLRLPPGVLQLTLLQGLPDRRPEPCQPVLHQVVGGALLDHRDRPLLADAPGDDQEWDRQAVPTSEAECRRRVELREVVVGENHVEVRPKPADVISFVVHTGHHRFESRLPKGVRDQLGVARLVLQQEHAERGGSGQAGPPPLLIGGWFSRSQYRPSVRTASAKRSKSTGLTM